MCWLKPPVGGFVPRPSQCTSAVPMACAVVTAGRQENHEDDVHRGIYKFDFENDCAREVLAEVPCPVPLRQLVWVAELPPKTPEWVQGIRHYHYGWPDRSWPMTKGSCWRAQGLHGRCVTHGCAPRCVRKSA